MAPTLDLLAKTVESGNDGDRRSRSVNDDLVLYLLAVNCIICEEVFFVGHLKKMMYLLVNRRKVIRVKGLASDQTIEFTGTKAMKCDIRTGRVGYRDSQTGEHHGSFTSIFRFFSTRTIADV